MSGVPGSKPVISFRFATVALLAVALLAGCGEFRPVGAQYRYTHYRVQKSDTLYSIAFRFGYDYHEVAGWNHIPPPYIIHAGDDLLILEHGAEEADDTESASVEPPVAARPGPKNSRSKPGKQAMPARPPRKDPPVRSASNVRWSWPTQGKVAARFSAGAGRKGVDVAGRLGQPVKAAADGDVVYSGNGLIGYGNLVIIKHDEVFLSAYAHNRKLLVKEGDKVKAGQPIGEMGQNAKAGSILHFEIRRHGKPVDPLLYLPNQTS